MLASDEAGLKNEAIACGPAWLKRLCQPPFQGGAPLSAWTPLDGTREPASGSAPAPAEAVLLVDGEWRIVTLNGVAQQMFGCSVAEAVGQPLARYLRAPPGDSTAARASGFQQALGSAHLRRARERVTGQHASGRSFDAEISVSQLGGPYTAGGTDVSFAVLLRDLGEREVMEAALEALQRRIRTLFELAPVAIWIVEAERIVFANQACMALFGAAEHGALVGQTVYARLLGPSHAPMRRQMAQALLSGGRMPAVRERVLRLDGSVREVEVAMAALPDHGRTALQMVIADVTQRQRESAELEQSRQELQRLSASLVETREEERRRIARELHDELGQQLSALKMEVSSLRKAPHSGLQAERLQGMLEMIDETMASVRRIAADLRPLMLDDLGLNAAVEWLVRMSSRRMGLQITLRLGSYPEPLAERASIALYRMVQEALTNIARHAGATRALIEIEHVADELRLTVDDNGVGFGAGSMHQLGSHGLMGMRERCHMLGGTLEIGSSAWGGGRIAVRLPLVAPVPAESPSRPAEPETEGTSDGHPDAG